MITTIRKHMKSRAVTILMWLTVFSLVGGAMIPAIMNLFKKKELMGLAVVDNTEISLMEFRRNYLPTVQFIRQAKREYGEQANFILSLWGIDLEKKPEEFVLNSLIKEKVIQNAANSLNVHISKDYVAHKLKDPGFVREYLGNVVPPQVFQDGKINSELLMNYLERQSMSINEFDDIVYQVLKRELLFNLIHGSVYVSLDELKDKYIQTNLKKKYAIASFDIKTYLDIVRKNKLQDDEIEKYFAENKKAYQVPEKRSGSLWTFSPNDYGVNVSDKDVEQYYNKHKTEFVLTPGQRKVKRILIKIDKDTNEILANKKAQELWERIKEKAELFDEFVKNENQASEKDKELAVTRGHKDPMFEQAVFSIGAPNEISSVVKTQEGFEIIKLLEIVATKYKELSEVKDQIKDKVKQEKFTKEFNFDAKRIISQASDMPTVFDKFTKDRNAKLTELNSIEKNKDQEAIKLFGITHVKDYAFYTAEDKGYIIQLSDIKKSYIPKLEDVKKKVVDDLYLSKAKDQLQKELDKLKLVDAKNFESAVKKAKGSLDNTDWLDPKDEASLKELLSKKVPIKEAFLLVNVGNKVASMNIENGYVIELKEIAKFDEADFEKNKRNIEKQLYKTKAQDIIQDYIKWLERRAKVKINEQLLKRATTGI